MRRPTDLDLRPNPQLMMIAEIGTGELLRSEAVWSLVARGAREADNADVGIVAGPGAAQSFDRRRALHDHCYTTVVRWLNEIVVGVGQMHDPISQRSLDRSLTDTKRRARRRLFTEISCVNSKC